MTYATYAPVQTVQGQTQAYAPVQFVLYRGKLKSNNLNL